MTLNNTKLCIGWVSIVWLLIAASPLRVDEARLAEAFVGGATQAAVPLEFDNAAYEGLRGRAQVVLEDFPLAPRARGGQHSQVNLELTRSNTLTPGSRFVSAQIVDGRIIEHAIEVPDVQIFRGRVAGDDSSYAFIAFSPHGTHGYIREQGVTHVISPGPHAQLGENDLLVYNLSGVQRGMIRWRDFVCDSQMPDQAVPHPQGGGVAGDEPEAPCRRVEVAIETDMQFTDSLFGGDKNASGAYVAAIIGAASEIFTRDVNVELEVVFVRLWSEDTGGHPWTANGTQSQLFEFRDHWNANMSHVERHLAHFLSGRQLGGGIAWLNAMCHPTNGYAVSANMNGFFPYPLQDGSSQNWDPLVVTHEFGHNFGTPHTHNFCPPVDQCASEQYFGQCQDEQVCPGSGAFGTLMGYCHICPGGLQNVALEFHPVVKETILNYLDGVTNCYLGCVPISDVVHVPQDTPSIQEAINAVLPGGEVIVSPGTYFEAINFHGKAAHVRSTDGPEATIIDASGFNASVVRFSNAEGFQTILEGFTLTGGSGSSVSIAGTPYVLGGGIYAAAASPTIINCIITSNSAEFGGGIFNNNASPSIQNCVISYNTASPSSGGGVLNFSGAAPQIVDTAIIGNVAAGNGGGMSNQSSTPTVINTRFAENTAVNSGGAVRNIQSSAGQFIDCIFEQNIAETGVGGAFFNDASGSTTITDSTFCENEPEDISGSHTDGGGNTFEPDCAIVGDVNGDGVVDIFDLLFVLAQWGECPQANDCPADVTGDGVVDIFDLLLVLAHWG